MLPNRKRDRLSGLANLDEPTHTERSSLARYLLKAVKEGATAKGLVYHAQDPGRVVRLHSMLNSLLLVFAVMLGLELWPRWEKLDEKDWFRLGVGCGLLLVVAIAW